MGFVSKLLSIGSDKELKRYQKVVEKINGLEPTYEKMDDEELAHQTELFRERYANGESLDSMLPEAFAVVREASKRTTGLRHFDVQLIGGMTLHDGQIAEMKTGEGKTLVSTLAGYLNAISGKGVHIVTVNDYLAKRDSEWMGQIYRFLGMKVGLLQNGMPLMQKRPAYEADVTYGTNSEFGFDYLRDNMVLRASQRVQRGHAFAIVDEVDSILIDEARTPLIISGAGTKSASTYKDFARAVRGLKRAPSRARSALSRARARARRRFRDGRGQAHHRGNRAGLEEDREAPWHRRHLRRPFRPTREPPAAGAQGPVHVPPRQAVRGHERRGQDR